MATSKSYSLVILDTVYTIKSDESEIDILKAVALIHEQVERLVPKDQSVHNRPDKHTLITLAALQLALNGVRAQGALNFQQQQAEQLIATIENTLSLVRMP